MSINNEKVLYREIDNGVEFLRLFSLCGEVILPKSIADKKLVGIGDYAFAGENSWNRVNSKHKEILSEGESSYPAICTIGLTSIKLPESLKYIGNYTFYDCRNLTEISLYGNVSDIGGGAFMNCGKLSRINITAKRNEHTCLNKLLSELTKKQYLRLFFSDTNEKAFLLMPEYFEESVENGPARIFEHFTRGSGFRYRQCVNNGLINFAEYDSCFKFAVIDENEEICSEIALLRLMYPVELSDEAKTDYIIYLSENIESILNRMIQDNKYNAIKFLCDTIEPNETTLESAIMKARSKQNSEILSYLINTKNERFSRTKHRRFEL